MRLHSYLNEQYRYSKFAQDEKKHSERIIKKKLEQVKSHIEATQNTLTLFKLCMILSSIYHKEKIRFISDGDRYINKFKYVKGSDFYKNGDIEIFLTEQTPQYLINLFTQNKLKNIKKMDNKFFKELIWTLSHTKVYVQRVQKLKDMFNFIGYNPIKKHLIDHVDHYAYISAQELLDDNFSPTRSLYYDLVGQLSIYDKFLDLFKKYKNDELSKPSSVGLLS